MLVWHNIKNGRADLRGTAKIVLVFMVLGFVISLSDFDHVFNSSQEFAVLVKIIRQSLFTSLFTGLIYCALEPFVRRWWSEYLISWNRLLAGDFRDPMVGRDILIGGAASCICFLITAVVRFVAEFGLDGKRLFQTAIFWEATDSFLDGMAMFVWILGFVLTFVLSYLAIFLILYFFTRNKKVTIILSGILLTAYFAFSFGAADYMFVYVSNAILVFFMIFVLNRFGIVALASALFFFRSIGGYLPLSFDSASILFPQTVATLVIYFAIMAYAAYISIGGAKMFGGKSWLGD